MYRIMLADDEGIIIKSLTFIIEKHFGKEFTVESAKTGREIIELAEQFRPDVVFMDIQMPGINGIDAIREIKQVCPYTVFIVLSAYDRFEYAKEALQLGVFEYLTKPFSQEIIVQTLKNVIQKVEEQKQTRKLHLGLKEKLEIASPIIESGLIYRVLFEDKSLKEQMRYYDLLDIEAHYGYIMVLEYELLMGQQPLVDAMGFEMSVQNANELLRDTIKRFFKCVIGADIHHKVAILVPYEQACFERTEKLSVIKTAEKMLEALTERMNLSFKIGIGEVQPLAELKGSYKQALISVRNKWRVSYFGDLPEKLTHKGEAFIDLEQDLLKELFEGGLLEIENKVACYFEYLKTHYPECKEEVKLKILELVLYYKAKYATHKHVEYIMDKQSDWANALCDINDYKMLEKWFLSKIIEINVQTKQKIKDPLEVCIEKAKEYIHQHYKGEISLDEIARNVDVSPYYFSKLFKEITGENFIEYLTNLRIAEAKTCLMEGMSIKQAGLEVGYSDPNYFSRLFKKIVGMTPSEFKESHA